MKQWVSAFWEQDIPYNLIFVNIFWTILCWFIHLVLQDIRLVDDCRHKTLKIICSLYNNKHLQVYNQNPFFIFFLYQGRRSVVKISWNKLYYSELSKIFTAKWMNNPHATFGNYKRLHHDMMKNLFIEKPRIIYSWLFLLHLNSQKTFITMQYPWNSYTYLLVNVMNIWCIYPIRKKNYSNN